MPRSATATPPNPVQPSVLAKNKRFSLQQENGSASNGKLSSTRRNTIQVDNSSSPNTILRKKSKTVSVLPPTIAEEEVVNVVEKQPVKNNEVTTFTIEEERKSSKINLPQNGNILSRSSSANNSIKSSASMHGGSVQSLEVVREQYCCFQRKTRLEKILFVVVFVLSVIVVVLVVAIIAIGRNKGLDEFKDMLNV